MKKTDTKICFYCAQPIESMQFELIKPKGRGKTRYFHKECLKEVWKEWQDVRNITQ